MKSALLQFMEQHQLSYQRFEHPPVFTCEEARRLCPAMPGIETKNLFLCDNKGNRHFLVTVPAEASVDIKALGQLLEAKGVRFASADRLKARLGLEPGAVTLLAAFNDTDKQVEVVIDQAIWEAPQVLCHPLVNTETLSVDQHALRHFLDLTGHTPRVLAVPARATVADAVAG